MRGLRALLLGVSAALVTIAAAGTAFATCLSDPSVDSVIAAIFTNLSACDPNGDQASSAADLPKTAELLALPECPADGATLTIDVDDRSVADSVSVDLSGELVEPSCQSRLLASSYRAEIECPGGSEQPCLAVENLASGVWRHRFVSPDGPDLQLQYRKTLVTADSVPDALRFTHFASAVTVTSAENSGNGSLRNVLQSAAALPKPLLIRFHDLVFPAGTPTVIKLDFQLTALATDDVTIDGTDEMGESGNRVIDAQGLPFGVLSITGARNHIIGLGLRNAGGSNRDILRIGGVSAGGNVIEKCVIADSADGDAVSIDDGAGSGLATSINLVKDCEIQGAGDKGVKVTTGAYARVEGCLVHDNFNGGVQATLGGNLVTLQNVIEDNLGGTAQNGISVQGFDLVSGASTVSSRGDIVRRNGANGAAVRGFALASIRDGYLATNETSGLRVFNDVGEPATASAAGTTLACNGVDGAVVADQSHLDLGGGDLGSAGNNALTQNNLPQGGANLRNASVNVVNAVNNQWEHCGLDTTCNNVSIAARDLSDGGQRTVFVPAQAQRGTGPPVVTAVSPAKGRAGDLLRIYGMHFNAIDGHFAEDACDDVTGRNRCIPLRGNCVRIGGIAAPVEAVTPTMLVVRWPLTCAAPVPLVVTVDHGSVGLTSEPVMVCTNAVAEAD